jgi:outer membrane receptor protein involved in Fe transport
LRLLIFLFSIAFLATVSANASAQSGASVKGTVSDERGAVIGGANVAALNLASGMSVATRTDASGGYELVGLPFGDYRLSVSSEGFTIATRVLRLHGSALVNEDFVLVPGAIQETVTLTVGKGSVRLTTDTPQPVTVVDAQDIEARRPRSPMEAIERTPNLIAIGANPAATRPRLRGLASNRLLIILDGERVNNVRSDPLSGISLSVIDVMELNSAEVVSGAGSNLYGSDAMAGTINFITQSPTRSEHGTNLGLRFDGDAHSNGAFRRGAATFNWSVPRLALRLSGSRFRLGNYHAGAGTVTLDEVVRVGRFANELGNATGNNIARTFAVWDLPARAEILNGQGHGFNSQADFWLFASDRQSIRYRQLNSQHKEIGFAFITPPFDVRKQSNGFRRLDKYGLRYEGQELNGWMPRLVGGFYRQKYSFPDDTLTYSIVPGSSWTLGANSNPPPATLPFLTGHASVFSPSSFTNGQSSTTSVGIEIQTTVIPFKQVWLTTGLGYLRDSSVDQFTRFDFAPTTLEPLNVVSGRATTPDSTYRNLSWFNLLEYEPRKWLRMVGGWRVDNWRTEAKVTSGFPLGTETAILDSAFDALRAQPGSLDIEGAAGILQLIKGQSDIRTNRTSVTGNVGLSLRLPGRVNPYFRWGSSYREPGVTERYILRDFGDPTFSVTLIPNTELRPERGSNYEAGVKIHRERLLASLGYFRNNYHDFIRNEFSSALFVPANPGRGLLPISPFFPFHGVLFVQRANTARARIQGFETEYEVSLPLGRYGHLTPFGTMGWMKGSDLTPTPNTLKLIRQFYNQPGTPVRLQGSPEDAPLSSISPFGGVWGARYGQRDGTWAGEYEVRYQARVTRVDPIDLSTAISTQYGTFASLSPYVKHSLRGVYHFRQPNYRLSLSFGIDNLTNRFYFEPFQTAPAPGRSWVFGITLDAFNLLHR